MKEEAFEITGIEKVYNTCGTTPTRFGGFRLKGVVGAVDPFVDGVFMPDCLKVFLDDQHMVIKGKEEDFILEEMEWAKSQIGKTLRCEGLSYAAFATQGNVSILDYLQNSE